MSESKLEIVVDEGDRCGESPIWDFREPRLLWTDIPADVVYECGRRRMSCIGGQMFRPLHWRTMV